MVLYNTQKNILFISKFVYMTSLKSFFRYTKGEKKQKEDSVPFGENPTNYERKNQGDSKTLSIGISITS